MDEKDLERLGLTKNEAKVYLALLSLGTTSSKAIIERTSLHRQLVYDALDILIEKGLVSYFIESNRKQFKASDPKEFLDFFEKKEHEIEEQKKEFKKILENLEKLKQEHKEEQEATIFRGNKGIKTLIDDMLKYKEVLTIGSSDVEAQAFSYHVQFNLPQFHKIREQKKIHLKILFSEERKDRAKELDRQKYTESKVLPKEFTSNSSTNIYGNNVSIIMWGLQPFGILIKSPEIAKAQKKYFDLLWKMARKV